MVAPACSSQRISARRTDDSAFGSAGSRSASRSPDSSTVWTATNATSSRGWPAPSWARTRCSHSASGSAVPLANAFLKRFAAQASRVLNGFTPAAVERVTNFEWPGNVRQLQNEIQRAVLLSEGDQVDASDLSISSARNSSEGGSDTNFTLLEGVERNAIVQMLKETGGNKLETAKRLGIGRQTLYNKIKAYGIDL